MKVLVGFLAFFSCVANAQSYESRIGNVSFYRTTVGTTTAAAIPGASIGGNVASYKICNDAINVSTYLIVGEATDAATDGMTLLPGACFECKNCKGSTLGLLKVKGQAASNGYSVIQFRE